MTAGFEAPLPLGAPTSRRLGLLGLAAAGLLLSAGLGAPAPASAASLSSRPGGGERPALLTPDQPSTASPETDSTSRSVAARSRMLECGHQWSSMKKAGTATGTWKDFSRICLAQR